MSNNTLISSDKLTKVLIKNEIKTWEDTIKFVKLLPYGRNSNRTDFSLIITENKGSCSSKHAFLKKIADLNGIKNIKLILGIYKMDNKNTINIGDILINNQIKYIPEAHCYLLIGKERVDLTSSHNDIRIIENDIIQELEINPEQVAEFKVEHHKEFLKEWILKNKLQLSFEEIWSIREQCISNMTKKLE